MFTMMNYRSSKIGKLSCSRCSLDIQELNRHLQRRFCIDDLATHGNISLNCTFRNNEDETKKNAVNKRL
jgi:hypothetical protein